MSDIKKSERTESKLEVIHNAYLIRKAVTKLAENNFYINESKIEKIIAEKIKMFPDDEHKKESPETYKSVTQMVIKQVQLNKMKQNQGR